MKRVIYYSPYTYLDAMLVIIAMLTHYLAIALLVIISVVAIPYIASQS